MVEPYTLDRRAARLAFSRAAETYDGAAVLQREVGARLLSRLEYIKLDPLRIMDLGTGTGEAIEPLLQRYRKASVLAVDFAAPMVAKARRRGHWYRRPGGICADAHQLPLADMT
ncbi:MAG TPA: methyltransferase domain-containing protein, partial [Gammaproteobacteria bacterium]|nr:methyltransferase domain-containing protein [Gammaproteobacteria bacterium]